MQNVRHPKTHRELCELACRFLRNHGFKVVFSDRFHAWTSCGEHPDALGLRIFMKGDHSITSIEIG